MSETELEMVLRHIREGQAHLDRQREIVAEMERRGTATEEARELLRTFEHTQALHRAHLARIKAPRQITVGYYVAHRD